MEESGENWPSDSNLEVGDHDYNDLCFDDEEFLGDDDENHYFAETVDPMIGDTDRNGRRRELTERLLALSATIPGLKKKMDNTSILDRASNYVKQLQQRVRELEQEIESHICSDKGTTSCEVNSGDYYGPNDILPEVKARVLQKEVLVIIHCEKQKGIMNKILSQLQILHLSVQNSSVLPFGKSTLDITIIAQMGDGYNMTVDELVKNLRLSISKQ
ncbi:transcription factor bHLH18-like [Gastrolobium bilobum]|uniref:transcription factor bHLH18-like n=1 Tax=Gastrolobium bilobum TaxID=150636 RepID=UPI002AB0113F|nr:transcription factor bHLH18-like [Gastrolobium bilobum]